MGKRQRSSLIKSGHPPFVICVVVIQLLSHVQLFATPYSAVPQVSLSFTITHSLLMTLESMMPSNHLILCHPPLLLPSLFPSIRVFSNKLALLIKWTKYWSFIYSISPSTEYLGLIFFRVDWFDLLAVQGTLQHHSSKSIDFSLLKKKCRLSSLFFSCPSKHMHLSIFPCP